MFIVLIRTIILYLLVILSMRLMGKKQVGELEPFELAITIMISELASLPMQDSRIPLLHGIVPILTLLILQNLFSLIQLKSEKIRSLINGEPSILIEKGKIDFQELKNQRFNINDLMEELRLQGYYDLENIEYAILETSGQLSIIPKTEESPVTKKDLSLQFTQERLPVTLILDGKINKKNLKLIKKDEKWLENKLKKDNISSYDELLIAILNSKGNLYYQKK
ncbi:DUF421 domain-containing protein [Clostridium botulinum]|uniref:DUF421 domain-containing protein n=1 Tax=Clostridium botulinum TaxID=1491 RepID=UPI001A931DC8|nr:DUF421 domain-containing protein [Clostridium botulinum]MBO0523470.1 DUF421 domain-containing protein [Clostridium botulinum]MBO0529347.1 DUF421 domain-containing protein [Clostridium botulinum]MBO0532890.1 DUF421 domain-containing protein [Clostridium botulinum]MBO0537139.1 DUF421 domain-containing protein [Clostridium botulinum]MBO0539025.1 DUF421 domain-containing protein [Clostridium botulinum]